MTAYDAPSILIIITLRLCLALLSAVVLDRVGSDRWQATVEVPAGPVEYRYTLVRQLPGGEVELETEFGPPRSQVVGPAITSNAF
jgi:hypothetical protein